LEPALGPGEGTADFFDIVDRAFVPVITRAQVLDSTRGRAISRPTLRSHDAALRVIEDLVTLSSAVDGATADRWMGLCKGWVNALGDDIDWPTITRVSAVRTLEANAAAPLAEPDGARLYGSMDRVVIREPGWALAIAGASSRIAFY